MLHLVSLKVYSTNCPVRFKHKTEITIYHCSVKRFINTSSLVGLEHLRNRENGYTEHERIPLFLLEVDVSL